MVNSDLDDVENEDEREEKRRRAEKREERRRKKRLKKLRNIEKEHWLKELHDKVTYYFNKTVGSLKIEFTWLDRFPHKQEQEIMNGIKCIVFGISITYMFFFLLVYTFRRDLEIALYFCMVLLIVAIFGISFSNNVRCVFFLVIPTLASSRIRWVLMMYATLLTTLGPGINIMKNALTLRSTILCVYNQVKTNFEMLNKIIKSPIALLKATIKAFMLQAQAIWRRLSSAISLLRISILNSGTAVTNQVNYFQLVMNACNNKLALYNQCIIFFNNVYHNCWYKMPVLLKFLCYIVRYVSTFACKVTEKVGKICDNKRMKINKYNSTIAKKMMKKADETFKRLSYKVGYRETVLEFNETELKIDKSSDGVSVTNVSDELKKKSNKLMRFIMNVQRFASIISIVWTLIAVALVFIQSSLFKKLWLKKNAFQNNYLTIPFAVLERNAMEKKLPTILPLVGSEKHKYIPFGSLRWSKSEKVIATRGAGIILMSCATMISVMGLDYMMYYVVLILEPLFDKSYIPEKSIQVNIIILGISTIAKFIKKILIILGPLRAFITNVDMPLCKPIPQTPDIATNSLIGSIFVLTLLSLIFQVRILRLRHRIMIHFFPERAFQRAVWLRNYIRNTRGTTKQFIFSKVTSKFGQKKPSNVPNLSLVGFIITHSKCWGKVLGKFGQTRVFCMACSSEGNPKKIEVFSRNFAQCSECKSFFCKPCYVHFNNLCLVCRIPLPSTAETEFDRHKLSSDEEFEQFKSRYINIVKKRISIE